MYLQIIITSCKKWKLRISYIVLINKINMLLFMDFEILKYGNFECGDRYKYFVYIINNLHMPFEYYNYKLLNV